MTDEELLARVQAQEDLMIAVSTGDPRIDDVNQEHRKRGRRVNAGLAERRCSC